jgi:competence protein ComGC
VRNSGMTFIGILISLLIIALLTITLIKNVGVQNSGTPNPKNVREPIEKAKAVECKIKVDGLNKEVAAYRITNEKSPTSLDDITTDYLCPVFNVPYHYDRTSGKVWCPKHDQR